MAARKTLSVSRHILQEGQTANIPQPIRLHGCHKLIAGHLAEMLMLPVDPRIREKYIQPPVLGHRILNHALHGRFIRRVELPHVHVHSGVQGLNLARVRGQMRRAEVANIHRFRAVVREQVCACAADTGGRVGSCGLLLVGRLRGAGVGRLDLPVTMTTLSFTRLELGEHGLVACRHAG